MSFLSDHAKRLLDAWITTTPEDAKEPPTEEELEYADNLADEIGDERWIQDLEEKRKGQE